MLGKHAQRTAWLHFPCRQPAVSADSEQHNLQELTNLYAAPSDEHTGIVLSALSGTPPCAERHVTLHRAARDPALSGA